MFQRPSREPFRRPDPVVVPPPIRGRGAFTLLELIVVLSIMGLLAAISLPAMKNIRKSNAMVSAGRQLVDDLALARAKAITERTTVHVFFVPPEIMTVPFTFNPAVTPEGQRDRKVGERLKSGQFTTYALFAERSVGDQPGRPQFRYLTSWRALPDGVFIATEKFQDNPVLWNTAADLDRPFEYIDPAAPALNQFPFPTVYGLNYRVPHIAFDNQGRLVDKFKLPRLQDEVIPLARGSILYTRGPGGALVDFDVRETPPGNATNNFHRVRIDGLTGRARVETPQVQ